PHSSFNSIHSIKSLNMKKMLWAAVALVTTGIFAASCAHKVTRIDPEEQIDLSGRWNNTDSRLVAGEMITTILREKWVNNHVESNNGEKPVVIVGMVTNKSHEHIDAETF